VPDLLRERHLFFLSVYLVQVTTSDIQGASSDDFIWIKIRGDRGTTEKILLDNENFNDFQQGRYMYCVYII